MIRAYDEIYLEKSRLTLACMLDHAVNSLALDLSAFMGMFIATGIGECFEHGDAGIVAGRSGIELAHMVAEKSGLKSTFAEVVHPRAAGRSREYWMGWALGYYQWYTSLPFAYILKRVPAGDIRDLYDPYHEMDVMHFCDRMSGLISAVSPETNLKRLRVLNGMSQSQLARDSGVPLRTIQQYEQRQKDINKAQAEYIIKLSGALNCSPEVLIERL